MPICRFFAVMGLRAKIQVSTHLPPLWLCEGDRYFGNEVLTGAIISPDAELSGLLERALTETGMVRVARTLPEYPASGGISEIAEGAGLDLVFLCFDSRSRASEVASQLARLAPSLQVVGFARTCDPPTLLESMRCGIREFLPAPFERQMVRDALSRLSELVERRRTENATDAIYAFLPAKAGVGCSTIALNTAVALSALPQASTLLADFDLNCGILGFMLQCGAQYSIVDAAENAHDLDDNLWNRVAVPVGKLHLLAAGKPKPGFRIEIAQLRRLLDFARRRYTSICLDLSGMMEKFSIELLHSSKRIFLVCTPEIPALHLAREKIAYLGTLGLKERTAILLNRSLKQDLIAVPEIQKLLETPVQGIFPNDYHGVHRALAAGKPVDPGSELGGRFRDVAKSLSAVAAAPAEQRRGILSALLPKRAMPAAAL